MLMPVDSLSVLPDTALAAAGRPPGVSVSMARGVPALLPLPSTVVAEGCTPSVLAACRARPPDTTMGAAVLMLRELPAVGKDRGVQSMPLWLVSLPPPDDLCCWRAWVVCRPVLLLPWKRCSNCTHGAPAAAAAAMPASDCVPGSPLQSTPGVLEPPAADTGPAARLLLAGFPPLPVLPAAMTVELAGAPVKPAAAAAANAEAAANTLLGCREPEVATWGSERCVLLPRGCLFNEKKSTNRIQPTRNHKITLLLPQN